LRLASLFFFIDPGDNMKTLSKTSSPSLRRLFRGAIGLAVALLAGAAAAQGKGETDRIQDHVGIATLPVRIAIAKGYCASYGIKCELQPIPTAALGIQALMAKNIDVAGAALEVWIPAVQKGAKLKAVVNIMSKNLGLMVVGSHVDAPNAGKPFPDWVKDMKGKKIGVTARGTGVETGARYLLEKAGMKADDVTFVAVGAPNTAYAALVNKQIDFAMSYEPMGTMCDVTKQCKVVYRADADPRPAEIYATNGGGAALLMNQAYIDANPHVVEALIKATRDAHRFINDPANFDEVLKINDAYFKFEIPNGDALMRALLQRQIKHGIFDPRISRPAVKATVDYMLQTGQWDKSIEPAEIIDARAP
jgi:NitT/TauT family transport system substrate-binding protein